jgi:SAM-dependent methyltransferase
MIDILRPERQSTPMSQPHPERPPGAASGFTDPAQTWNRRFADEGFLFGTDPNGWLQAQADVWAPGQRVLCVADGEGRNSVWLAARGLQVDAFDIAEAGVAKARRLAASQGVHVNLQVADCDGWTWPVAAYDGVAAIFVQFADPAMRERLFARIVASLRPGGTLVLQGYTPQQLEYRTGGPGIVSHLYTEAMLREAFAGMHIEKLHSYEADLAEGSGHHGRSALVGLVARKP